MKQILIISLLLLSGCASEPKRGFELPIALSEVFRNGELKGLEATESADLGIPNQDARVSRVCASQPIYNMAGKYIRTSVKCW